MERAFFLIIAVSLAFGVGCLGRNRRIGFGWAFCLSMLNLIVGLVAVLCSKKIPQKTEEISNKEDVEL